jgi:hypothetical protein
LPGQTGRRNLGGMETPPPAPPPLPGVRPGGPPSLPPPGCAACAAPLGAGWTFCPACGHRREAGRLTLKVLLGDLFGRTVQLERGFARTFLGLSTAPARTCRAYVDGARRTTPPLGYLFLSAAFALLLFSFQAEAAREELRRMAAYNAAKNPLYAAFLHPADVDRYVEANLGLIEAAYPYQLILMTAPLALLLRAFFRRPYNLAEVGVLTIYTTSHAGIVGAVLSFALTPWLGLFGAAYLVLALAVVYQGLTAAAFFGVGRVRGVVLTLVASFVAYVLYGIALDAGLLAYVALT